MAALFGSCCSSYYLEWHFNTPQRSDLLCSLLYENGSRLNDRLRSVKVVSDDRQWKVLSRFLSTWDSINAKLDGLIPHIWLACDFNMQAMRFDPPNIHFCLDKKFTERERLPGYVNILTQRQFNRAVKAIIEGTVSRIPGPAVTSLQNCFRAFNAGGEVLHLSFMHGRIPPVFKLNCTIPRTAVIATLSAAHWPGNLSLITTICDEFAPDEKRIKCNICMDGKVCNRFELELEYNSPLQTDPRRKPMLASLLRRGLVTRRQVQYLLKWPGSLVVHARPGNESITFQRWLDIKICVDEEGSVTAKAYAGFAPLPLINW